MFRFFGSFRTYMNKSFTENVLLYRKLASGVFLSCTVASIAAATSRSHVVSNIYCTSSDTNEMSEYISTIHQAKDLLELYQSVIKNDTNRSTNDLGLSLSGFLLSQIANQRLPNDSRIVERALGSDILSRYPHFKYIGTNNHSESNHTESKDVSIHLAEFLLLSVLLRVPDEYLDVLLDIIDDNYDGTVTEHEIETFSKRLVHVMTSHIFTQDNTITMKEDEFVSKKTLEYLRKQANKTQSTNFIQKIPEFILRKQPKETKEVAIPLKGFQEFISNLKEEILRFQFYAYASGYDGTNVTMTHKDFLRYLVGQYPCNDKTFEALLSRWENWTGRKNVDYYRSNRNINEPSFGFEQFQQLHRAFVSKGHETSDAIRLYGGKNSTVAHITSVCRAVKVVGQMETLPPLQFVRGLAYIFDPDIRVPDDETWTTKFKRLAPKRHTPHSLYREEEDGRRSRIDVTEFIGQQKLEQLFTQHAEHLVGHPYPQQEKGIQAFIKCLKEE